MTQAERDLRWMAQALDQARAAQALDEVPVGAVLVREDTDTVLGVGFNRPIREQRRLDAQRRVHRVVRDPRLQPRQTGKRNRFE